MRHHSWLSEIVGAWGGGRQPISQVRHSLLAAVMFLFNFQLGKLTATQSSRRYANLAGRSRVDIILIFSPRHHVLAFCISAIRISAAWMRPGAAFVISRLTHWATVWDCVLSDRIEWMEKTSGLMQSDTLSLSDSPNGLQTSVQNRVAWRAQGYNQLSISPNVFYYGDIHVRGTRLCCFF